MIRIENLFYLRVAKGGLDRTLNLENSRVMYIKENTSIKYFFLCTKSSKEGGGVLLTIHAQNLVNSHFMCIEEKTSNNCSVYKVSQKS